MSANGLAEKVSFNGPPKVEVWENSIRFSLHCDIKYIAIDDFKFVIRWGSYDDVAENWEDLELGPDDVTPALGGGYTLTKIFRVERKGYYGATLYATHPLHDGLLWQGTGPQDDGHFRIHHDSPSLMERITINRDAHRRDAEKTLFEKIENFDDFETTVDKLASNGSRRELARIIYEKSKDDSRLRDILSDYYSRTANKNSSSAKSNSSGEPMHVNALPNVLNTIGIGEVVLVAPEGPHAISGGLAQVMNGLLKAFSKSGVPVTFIAPLYEYAQGSKHESAEHILRNGIWLDNQCVKVKRVGEIDIPFGPTYRSNSSEWVQHRHDVNSAVYKAECGDIRIFLLRHARYADKLYPTLMPDEHLRRAIFLARGALELMRCPLFEINPQLILSNDWLSALVPVFMKLDTRYSEDPILSQARTVHLIHNCGRDYHGRIPARHDGQELYPMLELDPFHYQGLTDPKDQNVMNLTAAAIYHLDGALLAVSKPYAQQLMTWDGGEGLHDLVWNKRQSVFGISNAVDQESVRRTVVGIGEDCLQRLGEAVPPMEDASNTQAFVDNLLTYKWAAKRVLQQEMGLEVNSDKTLISFIGRLAEQKGIKLLSNNADGDGVSVLESLLIKYPELQIVVAGPAVEGDSLASQFCGVIEHLRRVYPGRIAGIYDFVHHDYALKVFTASDFSLMPSRYEPGGLTQLESLACGTLVVARNVGGLSATLQRFDDAKGCGNGFLFDDYTSTALRNTICWAIDRTQDKDFRLRLVREAAMAEHDWSHRIPQYLSIFQHITGVLSNERQYKHLEGRASLLACLRA